MSGLLDQQKKAGNKGAAWDGVRNYQAANNLKEMKVGDLMFFLSFKYWQRNSRYCKSNQKSFH